MSCWSIPKLVTCITSESQYCQGTREFLAQFNKHSPVWRKYSACKNSMGERLTELPTGRAQRGIPRNNRQHLYLRWQQRISLMNRRRFQELVHLTGHASARLGLQEPDKGLRGLQEASQQTPFFSGCYPHLNEFTSRVGQARSAWN